MRAVQLATGAVDAEEALAGVLEEAVGAVGAAAGAVLEQDGGRVRAAHGVKPSALLPLLEPGRPLAEALARRDPWLDAPLLLAGAAPAGGDLLLAAMQVRGAPVGSLVLLAARGGSAVQEHREAAAAFAGVAALVLENERLAEEARRAGQARDHFIEALNHEVRTPAMSLALHSHLLRAGLSEPLPLRQEKWLRQVEAEVATLVRVLDGVLALGEVETEAAGGDLLHPRDEVLELLRRVEPAANRKSLRIALYASRSLPVLQTDRTRFSRILLHLLANAIKYTPAGGIDVRLERGVRSRGQEKRSPVLMVRVTDSGPGIPPADLQRILEPFAQVEEGARTDSRTRGIGLGLSVARRLAQSLGGDLFIESEPGRGTTASLMLPYHR